MELETLIAEERPLVKKLSRGFARRREALMSPEDLEQEGYLFLCRFYERIQNEHLSLGAEAIKALSYRSLKNFYISLYRKFSRKKRTAEIVSLDFPIPTSGDPFKTLIFQEHLENLRGKFGGLEKEVFEILVGENGSFLRDMHNLWRGNGHPSVKVRQSEIAGWLGVSQCQVTNVISVLKEKVASEFHYKKNKTKELVMFGVPEEEDCFGKMYDEMVADCTDGRCEQWKECKELTEEKDMSSKKQKKEKQKKRQFAARTTEKREEQKEKKAEFKEKIDRKIVNPWQSGSGRAYAFDLLVEGGTKNELVDRLAKIVREKGLKFDPKKRITRTLQDYRFQIDEKCKPYQLLEDGEGGWKTFRVVKRDTLVEEEPEEEKVGEEIEEKREEVKGEVVEGKKEEEEIEEDVRDPNIEMSDKEIEEQAEERRIREKLEKEEKKLEEEATEDQGVKVSEEYRDLVPRLSSEDFARLEDSIKKEGVRDPIVVNSEGVILDGYTRFEIATALGVEFETVERNFADELEEKEFVIRTNLERRHLNQYQCGVLGLGLVKIEEEKAKERQRLSLGRGKKGKEKFPDVLGQARDIAAKAAGISGRQFDKIKKIEKKATPEQKKKLTNGELSVNAVYRKVEDIRPPKVQPPREYFSIIFNLKGKKELLFICGKDSALPDLEGKSWMLTVLSATRCEAPGKIQRMLKELYPEGRYLEVLPDKNTQGNL